MGASLLVFKNKSDVSGAMTEDEVRQVCDVERDADSAGCQANPVANAAQGLRLDAIQTHKWTIMACSAMTGTNLREGLQWVVQDAKSRLFLY